VTECYVLKLEVGTICDIPVNNTCSKVLVPLVSSYINIRERLGSKTVNCMVFYLTKLFQLRKSNEAIMNDYVRVELEVCNSGLRQS
jgi:hypothetical protein